MTTRRKARISALNTIYLIDVCEFSVNEAKDVIFNHVNLPPNAYSFAISLIDGVISNIKRIDALISEAAENWKIERIPAIDKNILRIAIYELMSKETPVNVIIDEAIEIAKKYSSVKSFKFINGVLDRISKVIH